MKTKKLILNMLAVLGVWAFWANNSYATTWYVRDGGGTSTQCTGKTNAVYPGSGSAQPCAFNHPAWALGASGASAKMAGGDTLYIVGDSDITWNFTVSGVSTLPAVGDEYTVNGVTYTVSVTLPPGSNSGNIAMTGTTIPPALGTLTVVSGHGSGTSPITYTGESVAKAEYMIGYGMPNSNCSTSSASTCEMNEVPAGISAAQETKILGLVGSDGLLPQLWGTEGVRIMLNLNGSGNYDIESLEMTQHSSCNGVVLTAALEDGYPAGCGNGGNSATTSYPYGPSAATATWAYWAIQITNLTNLTTANMWIHNIGQNPFDFEGTLTNWNSSNDRFIAAGEALTQNINGSMSFAGTNTMTNDVWAWGGCMEKYPLPDPGNVKDINNYINCADTGYGGNALGGDFMNQNSQSTNGACGNWNVYGSQFLFGMKTNWDFLHCNGTGQVNIYRSRFEGSSGESLKLNVGGIDVEESQLIDNAPVWTTPQFQALKAPQANGSTSWQYNVCRGDANFIAASNPNEKMNFVNDDMFGNCNANFQVNGSQFSFNSCTGVTLNVYNTKILNGYAYDNTGKSVNSALTCGANSTPFTVMYHDSNYNDNHSVCYSGEGNVCGSDPLILGEATTSYADLFGCSPSTGCGSMKGAYYSGLNLSDLFYLQSSSPLRNAGSATGVTYTNGSSNDYNNYAVTDGSPAVDIGAVQYNSCIGNSTGSTNGFCSISAQCCGGSCNSEGQCGTGSSTPQPVVAITSPSSGSSVSSGSNVSITAAASESNGTITNISIYNGSALLGSSSTSPYTYVMNDPANGTYTLTAKATDAKGVSTTSSAVTVTVTAQSILPSSPVVTITAPSTGSSYTVGSNVTITTAASETNGTITNISLYNGLGILLGSSSSLPYSYVYTNILAGTYTFYAVATDANGVSTTSSSISTTVATSLVPVVAIASPANGSSYNLGSTFTITASASESNGTITKVQYYSGVMLLASSTTSPYTASWTNATAGTYTLTAVATDANGVSTTSSPIIITVTSTAPSITTQPISQTVTAPTTATFSVTATGAPVPTYQWMQEASGASSFTAIAGATSASYTTAATTTANSATQFKCVVTNASGSVTSNTATLTVNSTPVAPSITTQPVGATVTAPATATFSVVATGTPAPAYQWMQSINGGVFTNISGAISASYSTAATTTSNSGTQFECVATNASGSVTSNAVTLTVNPAPIVPSFTTQPTSVTVIAPATAIFTVAATGTPAPTYQWIQSVNGGAFTNIGGATSASYTTAATTTANSGTQYECVVTNAAGSATSNAVTLTVNPTPVAPSITSQPLSVTLTAPATATFSVAATGIPAPSYQWMQSINGGAFTNISGATNASYTTGATTTANSATQFECVVTNASGSVTSNAATLTVIPQPSLPTISLSSPVSGASYSSSASIFLFANASETNGTIAQVQFFSGSTLLYTATSSPYSYTWASNPMPGTYTLTAQAIDALGVVVTSAPVTVTINAPPPPSRGPAPTPTQLTPTVTLTGPANGSNVTAGANLSITASASESNGTIAAVYFYNGSTFLGSSSSSPYSYTWVNIPAGSYSFTAKAIDATGTSVTSSSASVTVISAAPTVVITSPSNGSNIVAGSNLTLSATASETSGSITQVQFYNGSTLLGTDTTSPYTYTWSSVPAGSYSLTAKATDAKGVSTISGTVSVTATVPTPVVSITSPANGSNITAGSNVTVTASATETNGSISKVEFFNGSTLLGTVNSSPYSYTMSNVSAGNYSLTAEAFDNNSNTATSAAVAVVVSGLPTVTITSPANASDITAGSNLTMTASASEANGVISKVEFFNGSTLLGTSSSSPYSYTWSNVPAGDYNLTAEAFDNNGNTVTSGTVALTVTGVPVVSISSPVNTSSYAVGSNITITANASEANGTITQVQFYNGSTLLGTSSSPYSYTWSDVGAGSYSLTAKATDANGVSTASAAVTVTVAVPTPVVSITSPANASSFTVGSNVTITAAASETNGSIAQVQFYNGSTLLGSSSSSPYTYTLSNAGVGSYSLTAKATDANGATATSTALTVTVSALPPVVALTSPANGTSITSGSNLTMTASASETDGTIAEVNFYNGSTFIGSSTAPYSFTWNNAPAGTYSLTAQAVDVNGVSTTSAPVTVTVAAPALPVVAITSPTNGGNIMVGSNMTVTASAWETNGTIAQVQFYNGSTLVYTDTSSPYTYTWVNPLPGTYTLTAQAVDANGVVVASAPVSVSVNPPSIGLRI